MQWEGRYREDSSVPYSDWGTVALTHPTKPDGSPDHGKAILSAGTPGYYQVQARNGSSDTWKQSPVITVVAIEKIQYKMGDDSYQDVPSTLVLAKGTNVKFKAIKSPSSAQWPDGKPDWTSTSGDLADGEEEVNAVCNTASLNPTDYRVVEVECGNTVSLNLVVVDLELLTIEAKRTSTPPEDSYPVKGDEHVEVGGTFQYELMLNTGTVTWPAPEKLNAEIWAHSLLGPQIIATGSGSTISYTFQSGLFVHDPGDCYTRFYCDENTSGNSKGGWNNDPKVDSEEYVVKKMKEHALTFAHSSAVSPTIPGGPDYAAACLKAQSLIIKKDSADDWRAIAEFDVSSIGPVVPEIDTSVVPNIDRDAFRYCSGSPLDLKDDLAYYRSQADVLIYVVKEIQELDSMGAIVSYPRGVWISYEGETSIFVRDDRMQTATLVHELGHEYDLPDIPNSNYIMESGGTNRTLLLNSDVDNYE